MTANLYQKETLRQSLLLDALTSIGLALLLLTTSFLNCISMNAYFAFNVFNEFFIPHLQGVGVISVSIYFVILISRYFRFPRLLLIFAFALLLMFVVRGIFSVAGIQLQSVAYALQSWFSFLNLTWLDAIIIKRIGAIVLLGLGLVVLSKVAFDATPLIRASAALGWTLGIITIFRVLPLINADSAFLELRQQIIYDKSSVKVLQKRVVWIIFDELDYYRLFVNRSSKLSLPHIDQLKQQSVSAENAVSPAWATAVSIPALTTGRYLVNSEPRGPGLLLLDPQDGEKVQWSEQSSIFSRLNDAGKKVSILGFYHPYCNIFPYATPCFSQSAFSYPVWWWGILQGFQAIPGVELLTREYSWHNEGFNHISRLQLEALDNYVSNNTSSLSYIHLNFPHLPGRRNIGIPMLRQDQELSGYEQNLLIVDWTVGKVVKSLEAQLPEQDILLIVSSDHWLRTKHLSNELSSAQIKWEFGDDASEIHKVPLLIRRMRETSSRAIPQRINTIYTAKLIEDFLAGKITDHASIVLWWADKPYIKPMMPTEIKVTR